MEIDPEDVLAWARTKPADEVYYYMDNRHCAVAQYLKERGICATPCVTPAFWYDDQTNYDERYYDHRIDQAANTAPGRTFGAFADCLEHLLNVPA